MYEPLPWDASSFSSPTIQAEIYHQCRKKDLDCFCEYRHEFSDDQPSTKNSIKLDNIVVHNGQVVCCAEAKYYASVDTLATLNTYQAWNYSLLPIPAYFVCRKRHAEYFAEFAHQIVSGYGRAHTRTGQVRVISDGPQANFKSIDNPNE